MIIFEAIPLATFKERMQDNCVAADWNRATHVVSLRQLVQIEAIQPLRRDYLAKLMANVPLAGDSSARVYAGCRIQTLRVDPNTISLGQTFVERGKYQQFLERFNSLFSSFCVSPGMTKLGACVALGSMENGTQAIAHYVPPIIERHGDTWALLDGVHRMFLAWRMGTTLETIVVSGVQTPFPADLHGWDKVSIVSEKPERSKRFSNLRPELFRDLKFIGLDG